MKVKHINNCKADCGFNRYMIVSDLSSIGGIGGLSELLR